jgi:hypothetical protein
MEASHHITQLSLILTTSPQLSAFVSTNHLRYPVVLGQSSESGCDLKILLTSEDLAGVSKSHSDFLSLLLGRAKEKGVQLGEESG